MFRLKNLIRCQLRLFKLENNSATETNDHLEPLVLMESSEVASILTTFIIGISRQISLDRVRSKNVS